MINVLEVSLKRTETSDRGFRQSIVSQKSRPIYLNKFLFKFGKWFLLLLEIISNKWLGFILFLKVKLNRENRGLMPQGIQSVFNFLIISFFSVAPIRNLYLVIRTFLRSARFFFKSVRSFREKINNYKLRN